MIVLAVDDEYAPLTLLNRAIAKAIPDAECYAFDEADDALEKAADVKFDIAFLDIHLRGTSGVQLAKQLKETNPFINIIFVTGYSDYQMEAIKLHASGYVFKPVTPEAIAEQVGNLLHPVNEKKSGLYAQTFGNFELFCDSKPVKFKREKSKELLALLIDRNGASLTTEQMASVLWEDKNYDRNVKNLLMPVIRSLKESLDETGNGDILIKTWGHLAVDMSKLDSDITAYNNGEPDALNAFHGEYMANYSWAEDRAAELYWNKNGKE